AIASPLAPIRFGEPLGNCAVAAPKRLLVKLSVLGEKPFEVDYISDFPGHDRSNHTTLEDSSRTKWDRIRARAAHHYI
ncbi:MAG: hypothetical protein ABW346_09940, partial [Terrimicrobium sp.]